jgi:hypothetical protein
MSKKATLPPLRARGASGTTPRSARAAAGSVEHVSPQHVDRGGSVTRTVGDRVVVEKRDDQVPAHATVESLPRGVRKRVRDEWLHLIEIEQEGRVLLHGLASERGTGRPFREWVDLKLRDVGQVDVERAALYVDNSGRGEGESCEDHEPPSHDVSRTTERSTELDRKAAWPIFFGLSPELSCLSSGVIGGFIRRPLQDPLACQAQARACCTR